MDEERKEGGAPKVYRYLYSLPRKTVDLSVEMPELTPGDLEGVEKLFRPIIQVQRRRFEKGASDGD